MTNLLKSIRIPKFRKLQDIEIEIAERITVIAGHNGIGKSTILGLIANCSELKSSTKSYFDKNFQAKFNEIFHLDQDNDFIERNSSEEKNSCIIGYEINNKPFYKFCTVGGHTEKVTMRDKKGNIIRENGKPKMKSIRRLKIVPRNSTREGSQIAQTIEGISKDSKVPIPTLYIGMSRVIPIGELNDEHYSLTHSGNIHPDDLTYLNESFQFVVGKEELDEEKLFKQDYKFSTKRSLGPSFKAYSYKSISLGQDSLSTILTALMSFKKLQREDSNYKGGILVIDEVDACLHPYAQENLLTVLDKACKEFSLQIILTSHSLTVLKNVLAKKSTTETASKKRLFYNVIYIQDTIKPKLMKEPNYLKIKNDMFLLTKIYKNSKKTLKVYLEDEEAKFMLDHFLAKIDINYNDFELEKINSQISCDTLLKLPSKDTYFKKVVIVVDNDVNKKARYKEIVEENPSICILPGKGSPEETVHKYLNELLKDNQHPFWREQETLTMQNVRDRLVEEIENDLSTNNNTKNRIKYKEWFNNYKHIFESTNLIEYWMEDNQEQIEKFKDEFTTIINYMKTFYIKNDN